MKCRKNGKWDAILSDTNMYAVFEGGREFACTTEVQNVEHSLGVNVILLF